MSFRRILCPVDLSPLSVPLLAHAVALADGPGARVQAVHVLDLARVQAAVTSRRDAGIRLEADHALRDLVREVRLASASPVTIDAEIVEGAPAAVILGRTRREPFDLVVMGTHAPGRPGRGGFGSTLGGVLCASRVPVLVWPAPMLAAAGAHPGRVIAHAIAAIDFAEASIAAARLAADVARHHAVDLTLLYVAPSAGSEAQADDPHVLRRRHTLAELTGVAEGLAQDGPKPAVVIREGTASEQISAAAAERPGTLAVMGLRRGSWAAVPPGSLALRVLAAGRHPVLAVPARAPRRRRLTTRGSLNRSAAILEARDAERHDPGRR